MQFTEVYGLRLLNPTLLPVLRVREGTTMPLLGPDTALALNVSPPVEDEQRLIPPKPVLSANKFPLQVASLEPPKLIACVCTSEGF